MNFCNSKQKDVKKKKPFRIVLGQLMERNRRSLHAETFLSPVPLLCSPPIPYSKGLWTVLYAPEIAFGNQVLVGIQ